VDLLADLPVVFPGRVFPAVFLSPWLRAALRATLSAFFPGPSAENAVLETVVPDSPVPVAQIVRLLFAFEV